MKQIKKVIVALLFAVSITFPTLLNSCYTINAVKAAMLATQTSPFLAHSQDEPTSCFKKTTHSTEKAFAAAPLAVAWQAVRSIGQAVVVIGSILSDIIGLDEIPEDKPVAPDAKDTVLPIEKTVPQDKYKQAVHKLTHTIGVHGAYKIALQRLFKEFNLDAKIQDKRPHAFVDRINTPQELFELRKKFPNEPILTVDPECQPYIDGEWHVIEGHDRSGALVYTRFLKPPIVSRKHKQAPEAINESNNGSDNTQKIKSPAPTPTAAAGGSPHGPEDPNDPDKNKKDEENKQQKKHRTDEEAFRLAFEHATTETKLYHFFDNPDHLFPPHLEMTSSRENIPAQKEFVARVIRELMRLNKLPNNKERDLFIVIVDGMSVEAGVYMDEKLLKFQLCI